MQTQFKHTKRIDPLDSLRIPTASASFFLAAGLFFPLEFVLVYTKLRRANDGRVARRVARKMGIGNWCERRDRRCLGGRISKGRHASDIDSAEKRPAGEFGSDAHGKTQDTHGSPSCGFDR